MFIITGNALGFFTESGIVIPFSVDLSNFCRSFREERYTTVKIYKSHHILLVNEVYNVIKRNSLFDIRTTIWSKIIFRTQNRMNCKLCRIISGEYGFILVVHRFLQMEKVIQLRQRLSTKIWSSAGLVAKFHQRLDKLVARRSQLLLFTKSFKQWNFRVAICCFYTILTASYLLFMKNLFFFGQSYNNFHKWEVCPFSRAWSKIYHYFFQSFVQCDFSRQTVASSGTLFHLGGFLRHAVWRC